MAGKSPSDTTKRLDIMPIESTNIQVTKTLIYIRLPSKQAREVLAHARESIEKDENPPVWTLFDPYRRVFMAFLDKAEAERAYVDLVRSTTYASIPPAGQGRPMTKEEFETTMVDVLKKFMADKAK